jgi:hypothetical protein
MSGIPCGCRLKRLHSPMTHGRRGLFACSINSRRFSASIISSRRMATTRGSLAIRRATRSRPTRCRSQIPSSSNSTTRPIRLPPSVADHSPGAATPVARCTLVRASSKVSTAVCFMPGPWNRRKRLGTGELSQARKNTIVSTLGKLIRLGADREYLTHSGVP